MTSGPERDLGRSTTSAGLGPLKGTDRTIISLIGPAVSHPNLQWHESHMGHLGRNNTLKQTSFELSRGRDVDYRAHAITSRVTEYLKGSHRSAVNSALDF